MYDADDIAVSLRARSDLDQTHQPWPRGRHKRTERTPPRRGLQRGDLAELCLERLMLHGSAEVRETVIEQLEDLLRLQHGGGYLRAPFRHETHAPLHRMRRQGLGGDP